MATATPEQRPLGAQTPVPFRVLSRAHDTADTWTLELAPVSLSAPSIAPGQFMMVYALGIREVPISVSGRPFTASTVVLTVRAVGAVTRAICATVEGSVLSLRGPYGNAWPVDSAAHGDVGDVCDGLGLSPLRPVVCVEGEGRAHHRGIRVLYRVRTPADLLYEGELE